MKVRSVDVRRVWDCMLCVIVSEEGGDGEGVDLEAQSLASYVLRYVSLAELGICLFIMNRHKERVFFYFFKKYRKRSQ